jgi:hypothetical protein
MSVTRCAYHFAPELCEIVAWADGYMYLYCPEKMQNVHVFP